MRPSRYLPLLALACTLAASAAIPSDPALVSRLAAAASRRMPPGVRIEIESARMTGTLPLKRWRIELAPDGLPLGHVLFDAIWEGGRLPGQAILRGRGRVAVARISVAHNEGLGPENVVWEEREISRLGGTGYFLEAQGIGGLVASGFIPAGTVMGTRNTRRPAAVQRQQPVNAQIEQGPLLVSLRAIALDDGQTGEWIRVQNPGSRRIIQARVTGPGEVSTR